MGVARHDDIGMLLREKEERILQSAKTDDDLVNLLAHIEAKGGMIVRRDCISWCY